jgi:hypothetical protein
VNDVPVKIKGVANHQDFAGVGVAVPDKLQVYASFRLESFPASSLHKVAASKL